MAAARAAPVTRFNPGMVFIVTSFLP
jgi:hypothetical protein